MRDGKGRWVKGTSGNAGGRPRQLSHVVELARQHTTEAINTLATIVADQKASPSARSAAASVLLDRGWGKPVVPIELPDDRSVEELTTEVVEALVKAQLCETPSTPREAQEYSTDAREIPAADLVAAAKAGS